MNKNLTFSDNTRTYLCRYYEILDAMMEQMNQAGCSDSISDLFIAQMIPHHAAAVEMARNLLQFTTFIPLQQMAKNIIALQTKGIEEMESIRDTCSCCTDSSRDVRLYQRSFERIKQTMFTRMQRADSTNNIDADFIREMIPHHEGAVAMAKNALHFPVCPQLVPILESIVTSQTREIQEMQAMLRCMK